MTYALYWILEEVQTFYENLPTEGDFQKYFFGGRQSKIDLMQEVFKKNIFVLGMTSKDIVDSFGFEDDELLSVLGKKGLKTQDDMYAEILRVVRLNPLN